MPFKFRKPGFTPYLISKALAGHKVYFPNVNYKEGKDKEIFQRDHTIGFLKIKRGYDDLDQSLLTETSLKIHILQLKIEDDEEI